ncbi:MAG: hypothetical protein HXS44_16570 [Theionarchaea archaeon]|nr:hypothetical protein [Theionarchaea archaeon]
MATRQEIIEVIDKILEGTMSAEEAVTWVGYEIPRTSRCEDPASALTTILTELDPNPVVIKSGKWRERLLLHREVLVRGVPCPSMNLKTIQAYWMIFSPGEKVVLCQIRRTEKKERILELIVELWSGEQIFYEQVPLPVKRLTGPQLSEEDVEEKKDAYKKGVLTGEEALEWVIDQLESKPAVDHYAKLLKFYWNLRRPHEWFDPEYSEHSVTKNDPMVRIGKDLIKIAQKETKKIKKELGIK